MTYVVTRGDEGEVFSWGYPFPKDAVAECAVCERALFVRPARGVAEICARHIGETQTRVVSGWSVWTSPTITLREPIPPDGPWKDTVIMRTEDFDEILERIARARRFAEKRFHGVAMAHLEEARTLLERHKQSGGG